MAEPVTTPTRSRPALVFAGAAALVLAVGLPVLLLSGGGGTEPAVTTAPVSVPTTAPTPVPTTAPTVASTIPTTAPATTFTWTGVIYLAQEPENSYTGNPALVPFLVTAEVEAMTAEDVTFTSVLAPLAGNPIALPGGFFNAIPADVAVLDVALADLSQGRVLMVEMSEEFLDGAGGLLADVTMLNQLVFTLTQDSPTDRVQFTVGGRAIDAFGTEGISLLDPVGREDFLDSMNSIIITEPILLEDDGTATVRGIANVFEATVSLQIVDVDVIPYEDWTTATCGSGCWGEFTFQVETPELVPSSMIKVFWSSPEDGQPSDAVVFQVAAGDGTVWDLTAIGR